MTDNDKGRKRPTYGEEPQNPLPRPSPVCVVKNRLTVFPFPSCLNPLLETPKMAGGIFLAKLTFRNVLSGEMEARQRGAVGN